MDDDLEIRRPELRDVLRLATVRWWKVDKGYGRITADDGEVLFVGFGGLIKHEPLELATGQRVVFIWRGGVADHGRHVAEGVRVLGERCPDPEESVLPVFPARPSPEGKPSREEIDAAIATLGQVGFDLDYIGP